MFIKQSGHVLMQYGLCNVSLGLFKFFYLLFFVCVHTILQVKMFKMSLYSS